MASGWHYEKKPFQSWELSNNNAEIRRVRQRIESLTRANEVAYVGWEFDGGHVEANRIRAACRCSLTASRKRTPASS